MNKIFLSTQIPNDITAGSKAKVDVKEILSEMGYHVVYFPKINSLGQFWRFWKMLAALVTSKTHIVLEYPCLPRKRIWIISAFCFLKRIKMYGVIHDITDLRFPEYKQKSDMLFLRRFDGLVSHNASMTAWLRKKGYSGQIVNLQVFDYRRDDHKSFHEEKVDGAIKILYAGNLSYTKATYIYDKQLSNLHSVQLCVYGQHFDKERMNGSSVLYKGVFNPDSPELQENYHFGLIWEGTSLETCRGQYGEYIRFNNPHKFSLYLSLDLPVIVWKEAAIAPYVLQNNIGFTIESFDELETIASSMTPDIYSGYLKNMNVLSAKVKEGYFLRTAIKKLVKE